jgi:hypothetical protein
MSCPAIPNKSRDWEQKIQKQQESGLSVSRWCQENQIPYNTFVYWKRRSVRVTPLERKSFVELQENSSKSGIQLECDGIRVNVEKGFDSSTLARCLQTLRGSPC